MTVVEREATTCPYCQTDVPVSCMDGETGVCDTCRDDYRHELYGHRDEWVESRP